MNAEIKRIDPNAVAAWFQAHPRVLPARGRFAAFAPDPPADDPFDGLRSCCGLTSRVVDRPPFPLRRLAQPPWAGREETIAAALGLDLRYVWAFVDGWDDAGEIPCPAEVERRGHADGKAAYAATMEACRR